MTTHIATNTPTALSVDLDRLAVDLDGNDVPTVSDRVAEVVRHAHLLGLADPSLDVLDDVDAPAVVRARAVAVLVAHLSRIAGTARTVDHFTTVA